MTFSAILLNYNHRIWLPCALKALAHQVPAPFEIVVVDDGSTDGSIELIEIFRARHPSVRLVRHEKNRGVVAAINTGLANVSGEFLIICASDDFVLPGLFAAAETAFRDHPQAALFCSSVVLLDRDNRILGFRPMTPPRASSGYLSPADAKRESMYSDNWFVGQSVIYRRRLLQEAGSFDPSLGSLTDTMLNRFLAFRHGFCFEPRVLAAWRVYPESFSARTALSAFESSRLIGVARSWIRNRFPKDVGADYGERFERRLRFNMARLRLTWNREAIDAGAVSDLLGWSRFDRSIARVLARLPVCSAQALVAWMTLRLRPYPVRTLIGAAWRHLVTDRGQLAALAPLIAEANRSNE